MWASVSAPLDASWFGATYIRKFRGICNSRERAAASVRLSARRLHLELNDDQHGGRPTDQRPLCNFLGSPFLIYYSYF